MPRTLRIALLTARIGAMADFPTQLTNVTPEWVASCLGIEAAHLTDFKLTIAETRRGYGSEIGFISIGSDLRSSDKVAVPRKMIVKVPPEHPAARQMARELGSFVRESGFYRDVAPLTPIRTPQIYGVQYDPKTGDGVMLMQDCSHMQTFAFDAPADFPQLQAIVRALARMNAGWYGKTAELSTFDAIMTPDSTAWQRSVAQIQTSWRAWLVSELAEFAPSGTLPVCEQLARTAARLYLDQWPSSHLTLTHMDFHLQNIFFDAGANDPVVVFDWDGCHIGCGPHDLAYLLGMYATDQRRSLEPLLLGQYHDDMVAFGVSDYSQQAIYEDYRFGTLINTYLLPVLLSLDMSADRDRELAQSLTARLLTTMLDHDAQHLLA